MANITIFEQDLTSAGSSNVTDNVAYVPGYAIMGPLDTPTLCTTLSEFQQTFGAEPYKFVVDESVNNGAGITVSKNDYEKSYWYAAELLNAGLPVLFERISTTEDLVKASTEIPVRFKPYRGSFEVSSVSKAFAHTINDKVCDIIIPDDSSIYKPNMERFHVDYINNVGETYGADLIYNDSTWSTTDENIAEIEIASGSIKLTFANDVKSIASVSYSLETPVKHLVQSELYKDSNGNYSIKYDVLYAISTDDGNNVDYNNLIEDYTAEANDTVTNCTVTIPCIGLKQVVGLNESTSTNTGLKLTLTAKYTGAYGKDIKNSITSTNISGITYYTINSSYADATGTVVKNSSVTFTFDKSDAKYISKVSSSLIDLNCAIDLPANYLVINKTETPISLEYNSVNVNEFSIIKFYSNLGKHIEALADKGEYNIKFITSGSYPVYNVVVNNSTNDLVTTMLTVAGNRGDVTALIDYAPDIEIDGLIEMINKEDEQGLNRRIATTLGEDAKKYGAMFTPWSKYQLVTSSGIVQFPASFAYLRCLAAATKSFANWNAISGVARGQVPSILEQSTKVTGALAESMQKTTGVSINPITNIKPYGYCIWGNRTLAANIDGLTASSFLNIRMLTNDVKKVVYKAAKEMTFELNDNVLWLNFKAAIEPTLDQMVSGNGLSSYKITKLVTTKKATIACKITLYAIEAVEDWDITVELADNYVSVQ